MEMSNNSRIMNVANTKTNELPQLETVGNLNIKNVKVFNYLGNTVNELNETATTYLARMKKAESVFQQLRPLWATALDQGVKSLMYIFFTRSRKLGTNKDDIDIWDMKHIRKLVQEKDRTYTTTNSKRHTRLDD